VLKPCISPRLSFSAFRPAVLPLDGSGPCGTETSSATFTSRPLLQAMSAVQTINKLFEKHLALSVLYEA